ncbi:unnamed protein product [Closterium sp. NIES-64]|nr:unnamed protein product [Closterium sp. NIES-64]
MRSLKASRSGKGMVSFADRRRGSAEDGEEGYGDGDGDGDGEGEGDDGYNEEAEQREKLDQEVIQAMYERVKHMGELTDNFKNLFFFLCYTCLYLTVLYLQADASICYQVTTAHNVLLPPDYMAAASMTMNSPDDFYTWLNDSIIQVVWKDPPFPVATAPASERPLEFEASGPHPAAILPCSAPPSSRSCLQHTRWCGRTLHAATASFPPTRPPLYAGFPPPALSSMLVSPHPPSPLCWYAEGHQYSEDHQFTELASDMQGTLARTTHVATSPSVPGATSPLFTPFHPFFIARYAEDQQFTELASDTQVTLALPDGSWSLVLNAPGGGIAGTLRLTGSRNAAFAAAAVAAAGLLVLYRLLGLLAMQAVWPTTVGAERVLPSPAMQVPSSLPLLTPSSPTCLQACSRFAGCLANHCGAGGYSPAALSSLFVTCASACNDNSSLPFLPFSDFSCAEIINATADSLAGFQCSYPPNSTLTTGVGIQPTAAVTPMPPFSRSAFSHPLGISNHCIKVRNVFLSALSPCLLLADFCAIPSPMLLFSHLSSARTPSQPFSPFPRPFLPILTPSHSSEEGSEPLGAGSTGCNATSIWTHLGSTDSQRITSLHVAVARALYTAVKDDCLVGSPLFSPRANPSPPSPPSPPSSPSSPSSRSSLASTRRSTRPSSPAILPPVILSLSSRSRLAAFLCVLFAGEEAARKVPECKYTSSWDGRQLVSASELAADVPWTVALNQTYHLSRDQAARFVLLLTAALKSVVLLPDDDVADAARLLHALDAVVVDQSLPSCGTTATGPTVMWGASRQPSTVVPVGERVTWVWADGQPHAINVAGFGDAASTPFYGMGSGRLVLSADVACSAENVGTTATLINGSHASTADPAPCVLSPTTSAAASSPPIPFSYTTVFPVPGTFVYECSRMGEPTRGSVTVLPLSSSSSASSPSSPSSPSSASRSRAAVGQSSKPIECAPGCLLSLLADGKCNPSCNVDACAFDGGDCSCALPSTSVPEPAPVASGSVPGSGLGPVGFVARPQYCPCPPGQVRSDEGACCMTSAIGDGLSFPFTLDMFSNATSAAMSAGNATSAAASAANATSAAAPGAAAAGNASSANGTEEVALSRFVAEQNRVLIGLKIEQTRWDAVTCQPYRFSSLFQNCMNRISTAPFGVNPHFLPSSSLYLPDAYVALNDSLTSADVDTMQPIATRPDGVPYGFQVAKANERVFPVIFDINLDNEAATQRLQYLADSFFIDNATQSVSVAMLTYNGPAHTTAVVACSVAMLTYNGDSSLFVYTTVKLNFEIGGKIAVTYNVDPVDVELYSSSADCAADCDGAIGGKIAVTYNVDPVDVEGSTPPVPTSDRIAVTYNVDPVDVELYSSSADWVRLTVSVLYVCAVVWNLIEELVEAFQCWLETGRITSYFRTLWNWLDVLSLTIQFIGIIMWFIISVQMAGGFQVQPRYDIYVTGDSPFVWRVSRCDTLHVLPHLYAYSSPSIQVQPRYDIYVTGDSPFVWRLQYTQWATSKCRQYTASPSPTHLPPCSLQYTTLIPLCEGRTTWYTAQSGILHRVVYCAEWYTAQSGILPAQWPLLFSPCTSLTASPSPTHLPPSSPQQLQYPPVGYEQAQAVYESIRNLVQWRSILVSLQGINVFLFLLRLLKLMDFQPRIAILTRTMAAAFPALVHFFLLWAIMFIGFSLYAYVVFGRTLEQFSTVAMSMVSCFLILINDNSTGYYFIQLEGWNLTAAIIFWVAYISVMVFVMLNVLIAIVVDAFLEVRKSTEESPAFPVDMWYVLRNVLLRLSTDYWKPGRLQRHLLMLGAEDVDVTLEDSVVAKSAAALKEGFNRVNRWWRGFGRSKPRARRVLRVGKRCLNADALLGVLERCAANKPPGSDSVRRGFSFKRQADTDPTVEVRPIANVILAQFGEVLDGMAAPVAPLREQEQQQQLEEEEHKRLKDTLTRVSRDAAMTAEGLDVLKGEVQLQRRAVRRLQKQVVQQDMRAIEQASALHQQLLLQQELILRLLNSQSDSDAA